MAVSAIKLRFRDDPGEGESEGEGGSPAPPNEKRRPRGRRSHRQKRGPSGLSLMYWQLWCSTLHRVISGVRSG